MRKKVLVIIVVALIITLVGGFFAVPVIVSNIVLEKVTANSGSTVQNIDITWAGPQRLTGLHIKDTFGSASLDVELQDSLFSIITSKMYNINATGDVTILTTREAASTESTGMSKSPPVGSDLSFSIPNCNVHATITTLTFQGDESLVYRNLSFDVTAEPGRVFHFSLQGQTDLGGTIAFEGNAPDILTEQGTLNWESTASLSFAVDNATIPTINGQGGWSIITMKGDLSSPKLSDTMNVSVEGELAEYGIPKGRVQVKTQLVSSEDSLGAFVFDDKEIVGTVDLIDVPTTILAPLVNKHGIDPLRDFGPTMDVHLERKAQGPPMRATFTSENLQASGVVDDDGGLLRELIVIADVHGELIKKLSDNQIQGSAKTIIRIDQFVPLGFSSNNYPECSGRIEVTGNLQHTESNTKIEHVQANFFANLHERQIGTSGTALLNGKESSFDVLFHSTHKNKLHSVFDLYTTIENQLPNGSGSVVVEHVPTSLANPFVPEEHRQFLQYIGPVFSSNVQLSHNKLQAEVTSKIARLSGDLQFQNDEFTSAHNVTIQLNLTKELASNLFGVQFDAPSTLSAKVESADSLGNATFDVSFDIGKQHTVVNGRTTRQTEGERVGQLDLHFNATGIDTRLLDTMWNFKGLLVDSIGSPAKIDCIARDITGNRIVVASGSSPNAVYEASIGEMNGLVFTIDEGVTGCDLQLTDSLTQHLLKDLGHVLSAIRSVEHPIRVRLSNVQYNINLGISTLNADVNIDIGKATVDNGWLSFALLSSINTAHASSIPVFFYPISIEVRNGVATYKKFTLTLDYKYSIPYYGTINFVTRELDLETVIPLSGLGYSIKELRGLSKDIDVPYFITGTIDNPIRTVDPNFDLSKILLNAGVSIIGDALSGDNKDAPNPLDLIEDFLGNR